jgi:hypothetical protein
MRLFGTQGNLKKIPNHKNNIFRIGFRRLILANRPFIILILRRWA